jgi:P4 family phage/plasmid primase-like protien
MTPSEAALSYAARGWPVFPLKTNSKLPLTSHGFKDASTWTEQIRAWWSATPEANIGIPTGKPSGLVVVDVDVKNGVNGQESLASLQGMTPTLTARTPSGGLHLFYALPEGSGRCHVGLLPGLDIRGDGGYVVAPGSVIDGKPYEWLDAEAPIAALPEPILRLIRDDAPAALPRNMESLQPVANGRRNATLTSLAGSMRRRGMSVEAIEAALQTDNIKRCDEPLPEAEVRRIAASVGRYPPAVQSAVATGEMLPSQGTEDMLAVDFTSRNAEDWRYVAAWGQWLHWDGSRWRVEDTLRAFDLARSVCREAAVRESNPNIAARIACAATVAAVERLAKADRRHAATVDQWDGHPWLLNTPGGVVDLETGNMRPHERTDYFTKATAATPEADCPLWLKFLDDVTGGNTDLKAYLSRIVGYALTGTTREHALFFLYGTGGNGKGVFLNTLAEVLGDYSMTANSDTFLESKGDRHPTDLAALRGARMVIASEVDQGRRWAESKLKSLTGGDTISARFMRQDFFEFKPQFKLFIAGNHKPAIRSVDEAIRRRLHLVPFTVTIPHEKRDKGLQERLLAERDGILAWAVQGCLEWQKTGLRPPEAVLGATADYFTQEDALGRWIEEACVKEPNATVTTADLFAAWKTWAETGGEFVGSMKRFAAELEARGFARWQDPQTRRKGFRGLALR